MLLTVPDTIDDDGADMEAGTPAEAVIDDDDDDDDDNSQPRWLDISQRRILPREIWDRLYELIDAECKVVDLERRRAKGM